MIQGTPYQFQSSEEGLVSQQGVAEAVEMYGGPDLALTRRIITSKPGTVFHLGPDNDRTTITKLDSPMYKDDNGDWRTEDEYWEERNRELEEQEHPRRKTCPEIW